MGTFHHTELAWAITRLNTGSLKISPAGDAADSSRIRLYATGPIDNMASASSHVKEQLQQVLATSHIFTHVIIHFLAPGHRKGFCGCEQRYATGQTTSGVDISTSKGMIAGRVFVGEQGTYGVNLSMHACRPKVTGRDVTLLVCPTRLA